MSKTTKKPERAIDKLTPRQRDVVEAYTDPDSPTYGVKGRSTAVAYPNMTPDSAQAHSAHVFRKDIVKTAITEILDARDTGHEVRVNHTADLSVGRIEQRTITEQFTVDKEGIETLTNRSVVTSPTPAAVQLAALKKLSRDTGEDAVVGVQNKLIHEDLLKMGTSMLRDHQRALKAVGETLEPEEAADPQDSVLDTVSASVETESTVSVPTDADSARDDSPIDTDSVPDERES